MTTHLLITGGTVIDGTGAEPRAAEDVLLQGDKILALGAEAQAAAANLQAADVQRLDATGMTVMPGLIDAHTHLTFGDPTGNDELFFHRTEAYSSMLSAYNAQKVLRAGVTSVLDADCLWLIGVELRDAIEAGFVVGPRMRAGGNALMTTVGGTAGRLIKDEGRTGYAVVVRTRDEIVQEVRQQIKYGVDWIKVHVTGLIPTRKGPEIKVWTDEELRIVCDTAHELGVPVVGHCRNSESTRSAALAGMDLIYHASYMDGEALEAVVESGSALCPTFTLLGNLADFGARIGTRPGAAGGLPGRDRGHRADGAQGPRSRREGALRQRVRVRGDADRRVARARARDARGLHGLLAAGGDHLRHQQRRVRDADGRRDRRAAARLQGRRAGRRRRPAA